MEKIYIGRVVSTHGIKGEVRILSDFPYKKKVFFDGGVLLIDDLKYVIRSYRQHKIYDMVTLNNYKNINEVEFLIGKKIYVDRDAMTFHDNEILDCDLMEFLLLCDDLEGKIIEIFQASPFNKVVRFEVKGKSGLFPLNNKNIKIDKSTKCIYLRKEDVVFDED